MRRKCVLPQDHARTASVRGGNPQAIGNEEYLCLGHSTSGAVRGTGSCACVVRMRVWTCACGRWVQGRTMHVAGRCPCSSVRSCACARVHMGCWVIVAQLPLTEVRMTFQVSGMASSLEGKHPVVLARANPTENVNASVWEGGSCSAWWGHGCDVQGADGPSSAWCQREMTSSR